MTKARKPGTKPPPPAALPTRRTNTVRIIQQLLIALAIIAATFVAYTSAIRGGFIWDDDKYVTRNPVLTAPDGLEQIWITTLKERKTSQYYPLTYTTFWIEYRLYGGFNPQGFHVVNVLLHALNAILVACILKYLKIPGPWIAAAIFALHPVHVESVAWITERKNTLSGLFYLLSMLTFLRFEDRQRFAWYAAAFGLFVLAMLSKTAFCTLPAALILIRWFRNKPIDMTYVLSLLPFFAVAVAMGLLTAWYEIENVGAGRGEYGLSFAQRILLAGKALWFYPAKLTWPALIAFNYPRWNLDPADLKQWFFPLSVLAIALALWFSRNRIGRGPAVAIAFMAGTLVPALGFFDVFYFRYSFVADHFQYISSIGWIALLVAAATWALHRFIKNKTPRQLVAAALCVGIFLALGLKTYQTGKMYKNKETLWRETIRRNPGGPLAYNNLGTELKSQGRFLDAEKYFRLAIKLKPDPGPMSNLGSTLKVLGQPVEAEKWLRKSIETDPTHPHLHFNLGTFLLDCDRYADAEKAFRGEIEVNPVHAGAYASLGSALSHLGQTEEAKRHFLKAIEILPELAFAHFNLGLLLAIEERFAEAIPHFEKAFEREPWNPQYRSKLEAARNALREQQFKK